MPAKASAGTLLFDTIWMRAPRPPRRVRRAAHAARDRRAAPATRARKLKDIRFVLQKANKNMLQCQKGIIWM